MVIHIIHPPFLGEVYELFIQLADPYCGIGFVTVAPINHYVTGWRGRELGGAWIYGGLMGKNVEKYVDRLNGGMFRILKTCRRNMGSIGKTDVYVQKHVVFF